MRTQFALSLAVGLAAASPCKPLTSAVTTLPESSLTSSTTEAIEQTNFEASSSTAIKTSVTEAFTSTIIDTTSADAASTTLTTSPADSTAYFTVETSATETFTSVDTTSNDLPSTTIIASSTDATTLFTTETSAETTEQTVTVTLSETTMAEMSTTTTEAAEPTGFFIVAGMGPALGQKLQSSRVPGSVVSFNPNRGSRFEARRFTVDDSTGVLTNEGTPMCAFFNAWDRDRAKVSLCNQESHIGGASYIICDRSPSSGDVLHCTAVKLNCRQTGPGSSQECEEAEQDPLWNNQFFIQRSIGVDSDDESTLLFGQDNLSETFTSPYSTIKKVDLFVNVAMVSAPPP